MRNPGRNKNGAMIQQAAGPLPLALLQALRPRQWIKNGLIFLPFLFAVDLAWSPEDLDSVSTGLWRMSVTFLAFCCLSSAVYLFNDVMDRNSDRQHPTKRHRAIASGRVSVPVAMAVMVGLAVAGVAALSPPGMKVMAAGLLYLAISGSYCLGIKNLVVIDLLAVASGYVIRVGAGAFAIGAAPSPWLYVVTGAAALFIVLGRRYAEVRLAQDAGGEQRSVLHHYAGPFVGQLLSISATASLIGYTIYVVEAPNLPDNHAMLLTVPLVVFGLFRYLYLLHTHADAESPELLVSKDLPLVVSILCWLAVSAAALLLSR